MKLSPPIVPCGATLLLALSGALGLVQCKPEGDQPGTKGAPSSVPSPAWASLDIAAFAAAEVKIEHLRKQSTVDWAAIRAEVDKTMPVVRAIDQRHGLSYAAEIPVALTKCEKGESSQVNQQVVAKGLQHVAALGIAHELGQLAGTETPGKGELAERVASFAKGIRPTFVRRDQDYFDGQPTLVAQLDQAVSQLQAAVKAGQSVAEPSQALLDGIARTYALSVLYEIEQVEKLRLKDLKACEVKRMEAVIFYRIFSDRLAKQDPQAHGTIAAMLKAAPDQMSAAILKAQLQRGLPGIPLP